MQYLQLEMFRQVLYLSCLAETTVDFEWLVKDGKLSRYLFKHE